MISLDFGKKNQEQLQKLFLKPLIRWADVHNAVVVAVSNVTQGKVATTELDIYPSCERQCGCLAHAVYRISFRSDGISHLKNSKGVHIRTFNSWSAGARHAIKIIFKASEEDVKRALKIARGLPTLDKVLNPKKYRDKET